MSKAFRIALLLVLLVAVVTYFIWSWESSKESEPDVVNEAWQVIFDNFVDSNKLDRDRLSHAAIQGLIDALDDPYSAFLESEEYEISTQGFEGSFGGVGAEVTIDDNGHLRVVAPIVGTPAHREGILPGDRILEVDGQSTEGLSLVEAVLLIRGKPGTEVVLRILHDNETSPQDIVLIREKIEVASVTYPEILEGNIAHIHVNIFSGRTGSEIVSALEGAIASSAKGVILDLRNNPGGVVTAAVNLASQFIEEGIVLYALDNKGDKTEWKVEEGGIATGIPLAVLVNGNSASASEVVAGVLQDYGRGRIIGTNTLGKGSINQFHRLSDGSAIYITIARWYTPKGRQIEGQGIIPDDIVEITEEDVAAGRDPQLDRAIQYIQSLQ